MKKKKLKAKYIEIRNEFDSLTNRLNVKNLDFKELVKKVDSLVHELGERGSIIEELKAEVVDLKEELEGWEGMNESYLEAKRIAKNATSREKYRDDKIDRLRKEMKILRNNNTSLRNVILNTEEEQAKRGDELSVKHNQQKMLLDMQKKEVYGYLDKILEAMGAFGNIAANPKEKLELILNVINKPKLEEA